MKNAVSKESGAKYLGMYGKGSARLLRGFPRLAFLFLVRLRQTVA